MFVYCAGGWCLCCTSDLSEASLTSNVKYLCIRDPGGEPILNGDSHAESMDVDGHNEESQDESSPVYNNPFIGSPVELVVPTVTSRVEEPTLLSRDDMEAIVDDLVEYCNDLGLDDLEDFWQGITNDEEAYE